LQGGDGQVSSSNGNAGAAGAGSGSSAAGRVEVQAPGAVASVPVRTRKDRRDSRPDETAVDRWRGGFVGIDADIEVSQ
jgi:hypothetical protein